MATCVGSAKGRVVEKRNDKFAKITNPNLQDFLDASLNSQGGGSSTHKQINMPMWRTKSLSISLDFQKQVSHQYKRLSVPAARKTQTHNTPSCSERGTAEFFGKHNYSVTHLALRHRWGRVECAPNWQNYTAASHRTRHPSPQ